ncbi:NAD(P)/FAD-dependent oxidoreductase [Blastopirellula retiformator]|uniref:Thioredoxin reductase n=1 Tax=Blastopirellula retiformator TaxID=2527970 RepID=A0A5C5V418_9BACT|nr:NAD(P)/FAD-dependent oxidoreductase [Blastopirellula retiformator]TWT32790.1 Thioredoxin reductase [Blastopirellula retiformator]
MTEMLQAQYEAVVVGGGPAGLSAALVLGRACRRVLLIDAGEGRNAPADAAHGFLTQDGTPPSEIRRIGRAQLASYDVTVKEGRVTAAKTVDGRFEVEFAGQRVACRSLILATGIADRLPPIPGAKQWWGRGIVVCPYCHGWEIRDRPWAFLAPAEQVIERATMLLGWTKQLTYLTSGDVSLPAEVAKWLTAHDVAIREEAISGFEGEGETLTGVALAGGEQLSLAAVFVSPQFSQTTPLAESLGLSLETEGHQAGTIRTEPHGVTSVEGLFIAGDAASWGVMSVASAASEGMMAAVFANMRMLKQDADASE